MFGQPTKEILEDLMNKVNLLNKLDHPFCHYLVGSKIEVDANGGPLLLTEICEEGSLFDLYAKKQMKFDVKTAWRIAKECALGLEHIHSLGFMHRDLKSLVCSCSHAPGRRLRGRLSRVLRLRFSIRESHVARWH